MSKRIIYKVPDEDGVKIVIPAIDDIEKVKEQSIPDNATDVKVVEDNEILD